MHHLYFTIKWISLNLTEAKSRVDFSRYVFQDIFNYIVSLIFFLLNDNLVSLSFRLNMCYIICRGRFRQNLRTFNFLTSLFFFLIFQNKIEINLRGDVNIFVWKKQQIEKNRCGHRIMRGQN